MKWIAAAIRQRKKWIFLSAAVFGMMWLFMGIYSVPKIEIGYSAVLALVFCCIVIVSEAVGLWKKHEELERLSGSVAGMMECLPKPKDVMEEDYQLLIKGLKKYSDEVTGAMEQADRDMEDYYSMWVHQIKTPIAAMRLLLQTDNPDRKEMEGELFYIEQYVDMALQYIRLNAPSNDFVIKNQPLDAIVRETVRKYARQFIRKKIRLEYDGTDANVTTDRKWLSFVIGQLLSNAIKYTPEGSVAIRVKEVAEQTVVEAKKRTVMLEITDTGIGINREDIPRVCEKGFTGYNGHTGEHSTGIGLFLSKQMLTKMGHELEIESETGRGTTVRIVLG